jgi:hypothetical protein
MRNSVLAVVVVLCACGTGFKHPTSNTGGALSCDDGSTVTYAPRFAPTAGGSGVASAPDAQAGYVSSDSKGAGAPPVVPVSDAGDGELTAMVTSCAPSSCAAGEVAVTIPPPATGAGGPTTAGPTTDGPTAGPSTPTDTPQATTKCAPPPPACATGLSPQYTSHDTWECTDCALVVTYGGIYGNYRRCVSTPTIACPNGQVPTFSYEQEDWECKPTCDNGMYDQHTINGQVVCMPC